MRLGRASEMFLAGVIALGGTYYVMSFPGEAYDEWASSSAMIRDQFREETDIRPLSNPAARVALSALSMDSDIAGNLSFAAMSANPVGEFDLGEAGRLQVAILDDDTRGLAQDLQMPFNDERSPIVMPEREIAPVVAVNYERSFETPGDATHLDVSVTPRAGLSFGEGGTAAGAGAEVRVGRHLGASLANQPRWYMFAGADRRALVYNPAEGTDFDSAMALTRREVVGDAQAGVAVRVGDVDLALAYVMRDYRHVTGLRVFDEEEQFGALTVNWTW